MTVGGFVIVHGQGEFLQIETAGRLIPCLFRRIDREFTFAGAGSGSLTDSGLFRQRRHYLGERLLQGIRLLSRPGAAGKRPRSNADHAHGQRDSG
jgi:hypothetical protein